jgi:hypothetical protein
MTYRGQINIPFPLSSFPGSTPQESAGRLINCSAEPLGEAGPARAAYHRQPGLTQFAATAQSGYRGGLVVSNLSHEFWSGQAESVDSGGNVVSLGAVSGTKRVSIARDQAASIHVVVVDIDNGAFSSTGGAGYVSYNGGGNLPQPNSVTILDDQFVFGIADRRMFATSVNSLTLNSQTFTTLEKKADVTGQRVINYGGLLFGFTTGHCEVFSDQAPPAAPAFPFTFLVTIPWGLIQPNAIAGFETGFDNLSWVAQDYGVYNLPPNSLAPTKISPPDLDRLIEAQVVAGNVLEAGCYAYAGKKFWVLSSPAWTWEFNVSAGKWNERWSINAGNWGRWRATGGHPAFGKWLCGDAQSGNLAYIDDTNFAELGSPQLYRIESAPVADFPNRLRVARADFNFATGQGQATGATQNIVNPSVAISWSDDDGVTWKNPIYRALGMQGKSLRTRVSVKNTGISGPQARRWRIDVTDPVKTVFMSATQSDDPREN